MKKIILLYLLIATGAVFAQASQKLQPDVKKMYVAFDDIDLEGLTGMLCHQSDQQTAYGQLDGYFLNDDQKFRFVFTNVKYNYSDIKIIDGTSYCGITFRNVIRITYFKPVDVAGTQQSLKEKFNAQSVVYEKARNSFLIVYTAKMIASLPQDDWKFTFIDNTLPKEIGAGCLTGNIKKALGF